METAVSEYIPITRLYDSLVKRLQTTPTDGTPKRLATLPFLEETLCHYMRFDFMARPHTFTRATQTDEGVLFGMTPTQVYEGRPLNGIIAETQGWFALLLNNGVAISTFTDKPSFTRIWLAPERGGYGFNDVARVKERLVEDAKIYRFEQKDAVASLAETLAALGVAWEMNSTK